MSSHIFVEISPAGNSELVVGGTASISGTLDIQPLPNGFIPTNGELFTILTSTGLTGTFSQVNGAQQGNVTFLVEYSPTGFPNDVVLDAMVGSVVPEPTSLVMFGIGVAGVGAYVACRRRNAAQK
jgi:PEP-CTERM motif